MKTVIIYTTQVCPYCIKAKSLLTSKGVNFKEMKIDRNPELAEKAVKKSGGKTTVPQIFIGDIHVGGSDELYALEKKGKLDALLND